MHSIHFYHAQSCFLAQQILQSILLHSLRMSKPSQHTLLCSTIQLSTHLSLGAYALLPTYFSNTSSPLHVTYFSLQLPHSHVSATFSAVGTATPLYNIFFATLISIALQLNTFIPPNTFPTSLILDFTVSLQSTVILDRKYLNHPTFLNSSLFNRIFILLPPYPFVPFHYFPCIHFQISPPTHSS